ncbi:MAG: universal stress protein [Bacteroidia bacterium]|jgi:nucleotide-binding universal stress UspA family protein|nr:universal stress protein [Bacteroidia bacterium]
MKTILVPTDFSKFSENALNLAMVMARALNAKIVVAHVVQIPLAIGEIPYAVLEKEKTELKKEAETKLMAQALRIEHAGGIQFETKILDGEILSELLECIQREKISLVIMGTKGVKNIQDVILGSVTEQLIQNSSCPVMAVPEDIHFNKHIKHITFATDYAKSDVSDILQVITIAAALNAQVNVLHVSGDEINAEEEVNMMSDFMKNVSEKSTYNNLSFQILQGKSVKEKLEDYLKKASTDVLVTSTHHHNITDRLFGKSHTLHLLKNSKIPVIAFHTNEKA